MYRSDIINHFIKKENYHSYLEIGLCDPFANYINIKCENKESVDPYKGGNDYDTNKLTEKILENLTYRMTSDEMFNSISKDKKYDIIFIDGLHEYKQVARDIVNSLKHLNKNGKILVHDTLPTSEKSACDEFVHGIAWYGTVYKAIMQLDKITSSFYTVEETDNEVGLTIVDYFEGCENISFEPVDISYQEYEAQRYKKMHIISEREFLKKIGNDVKIFEMGHKPWDFSNSSIVEPLQVGAYFNDYDICDNKDNKLYNIGDKNLYYAELTGLYWIWGNQTYNYNYLGQTTYRRPFMINENFDIPKIFEEMNYEIILSNRDYFEGNLREQYGKYHNIDDFDTMIDVILEKYPEYQDAIEKTINQNYIYNANAFIMKSEDYQKYCGFLFDILFELENRLEIFTYDDVVNYVKKNLRERKYQYFDVNSEEACIHYQRKIFGFLSERILAIYINHNFKRPFIIPFADTPY